MKKTIKVVSIIILFVFGYVIGVFHTNIIHISRIKNLKQEIEKLEYDNHSLKIHMNVADHHRELAEGLLENACDSIRNEIYKKEVHRISQLKSDIIDSLAGIKANYLMDSMITIEWMPKYIKIKFIDCN